MHGNVLSRSCRVLHEQQVTRLRSKQRGVVTWQHARAAIERRRGSGTDRWFTRIAISGTFLIRKCLRAVQVFMELVFESRDRGLGVASKIAARESAAWP